MQYPLLPLRNVIVFPHTSVTISVGRTSSIRAIERALAQDKYIVTIAQKSDKSDVTAKDLFRIGTLCKIEKVVGDQGQGYQVLLSGERPVHILEFGPEIADCQFEEFETKIDCDTDTQEALVSNIKTLANDILSLVPGNTSQAQKLIAGIDDVTLLIGLCADNTDAPLKAKQEILDQDSLKNRALKLLELMQGFKNRLQIQAEISRKLNVKLSKRQRENILREQLSAIKDELDENDSEYKKKIEQANMPAEVKTVALDELKKLDATPSSSPESQVIRNYLDILCEMPWGRPEPSPIDLEFAKNQLNQDHYGLEKVKERIVQHLAVMKLKGDVAGSVLILVGPPGVGKTSVAKSIAHALGRPFVRASLGGVRDDAEVRGHRRTYIGAMPGKIIQSMRRIKARNPVFLLDEIDKMGRGISGDPGSALLEVLDPEQNKAFHDHYLDVPFDLSDVFFIATANSLETIPAPLLDRMEVIQLSGYTIAEKLHIAKNHLVKKGFDEVGIKEGQVEVSDQAIMKLITGYTREAGVRNLQRKINHALRAITEDVLNNDSGNPVRVDLERLTKVLGPEKFQQEVAQRIAPPGVATGLAWTPVGGEILFVEAKAMPGTGKLTITGQLGDVMRESAQIALSIARSHLPAESVRFNFDKVDIHVHVPSGAIPKDGPSAGVAMLTTLASLFTGKAVDPTIAMTGELTLRGAVMPVGGIKEKVLAAHRAGIHTVFLPKRNEPDLHEIPSEVKEELRFVFVERADEVLEQILEVRLISDSDIQLAPPATPMPRGDGTAS